MLLYGPARADGYVCVLQHVHEEKRLTYNFREVLLADSTQTAKKCQQLSSRQQVEDHIRLWTVTNPGLVLHEDIKGASKSRYTNRKPTDERSTF